MRAWLCWRGWAWCPVESGDVVRSGRAGARPSLMFCPLTGVWPGWSGRAKCFGTLPPPTTFTSATPWQNRGVARRPPGDGWTPYSMKDVAPESILEGFRVLRNALPTPPSSLATPVGVSAPPPPPEPPGFYGRGSEGGGFAAPFRGGQCPGPQEEVSSKGDPEAQPVVELGYRRC